MKSHHNLSSGGGKSACFISTNMVHFVTAPRTRLKKTKIVVGWICCLHSFVEDNSTWLTLVHIEWRCGYCYDSNKRAPSRLQVRWKTREGGKGGGPSTPTECASTTVLRQPLLQLRGRRTDLRNWFHSTGLGPTVAPRRTKLATFLLREAVLKMSAAEPVLTHTR